MLEEKIKTKSAIVGVIGLGYVGLPLAVEISKAGFKTIGFEISEEKAALVYQKKNYIGDVDDNDLETVVESGFLTATTEFEKLSDCDIISICVPTPLDKYKQPDLSYVERSCNDIYPRLKRETMVILESTTFPGTTEDFMKPILEKSGMKCGEDFYLVFSPERVDPGNKKFKTYNTPKIVGGYGKESTELARKFYEKVLHAPIFTVSSPREAEMTKIMENTFRIVNIALANEMTIVAEKMGVDIWEVIDAASTKPFGFMPFYPGPGVGGHCIPIDPFYLTHIARKYDYHTRLIELAGEINDSMPEYVLDRVMKLLNEKRKCLNGSNIVLLGVAYKGDIDDLRESPSLKILELLEKHDACVHVVDPYVNCFAWKGKKRQTDPLTKKLLENADLVLISTDHKNKVDYEMVFKHAQLIFDTRNIMRKLGYSATKIKHL